MKREEFLLGISRVTCIGFLGYLSEEIGLDNHWLGVIGFNMGILWGALLCSCETGNVTLIRTRSKRRRMGLINSDRGEGQ